MTAATSWTRHTQRRSPHRRGERTAALLSFVFVAILLLPSTTVAVLEQRDVSPERLGRAAGLAADPYSPLAPLSNPAAGSRAPGWAVSAGLARSFELPELDRFHLAAVLPLGSFTAGGWVAGFGRDLYTERSVGFTLAHPLGRALHAGAGLSHSRVAVQRYGEGGATAFDLGLLAHGADLSAGLAATNLLATTFDQFSATRPPTRLRGAVEYRLNDRVRIAAELVWERHHDLAAKVGAEIQLFESLIVRSGYDAASEQIHLGFTVAWDGIGVALAGHRHPWLGWSQAAGVSVHSRPVPGRRRE